MIISFRNKFIFVKTRKTGGTSVEIALSKYCGVEDVITPITPLDEKLRLVKGLSCQNYSNDVLLERKYIEELKNEETRKIPKYIKDSQIYYNHMPIKELYQKNLLQLGDFYKFTIERHPYEKAVSYANFYLRYREYTLGCEMKIGTKEIIEGIDQLIINGKLEEKIKNYDLYTINNRVAVDYIISYERLSQEIRNVLKKLKINTKSFQLPIVKEGKRDKKLDPKSYLTASQKIWIQKICKREFDLMNYAL